jgi:tetratricopeptide (TPR) repeat protein
MEIQQIRQFPVQTRMGILLGFVFFLSMAFLPLTGLANTVDYITKGDQAWAKRAAGHQGARAAAEPIENAIEAYQSALNSEPENLEARWKLLRAFHFKGEFVLQDRKERHELYKRGREIAEAGRLQIETRYGLNKGLFKTEPQDVVRAVGGEPAVAEYCFWAAANWGLWGHYSGKMISALTGLVYKIRQLAEIMVLMDESIENGGGHRLLGQFLARVPRIPFFTWWVDKDQAISELRLSLKVAPNDLLSKMYLAQALLKFRPEKSEEALGLLHDIVNGLPNPKRRVEDIEVIENARVLLAAESA